MRTAILILLMFGLQPRRLAAGSLTGTVTRVIDGDTVRVKLESRTAKPGEAVTRTVRLAEIDAPELKQPFGSDAKAALESMVLGKLVVVEYHKTDRYRRIIGTILLAGESVNHRLVEQGLAWHFRRYSRSQSLRDAEEQARRAGRGLWRSRSFLAPWEFRRAGCP